MTFVPHYHEYANTDQGTDPHQASVYQAATGELLFLFRFFFMYEQT